MQACSLGLLRCQYYGSLHCMLLHSSAAVAGAAGVACGATGAAVWPGLLTQLRVVVCLSCACFGVSGCLIAGDGFYWHLFSERQGRGAGGAVVCRWHAPGAWLPLCYHQPQAAIIVATHRMLGPHSQRRQIAGRAVVGNVLGWLCSVCVACCSQTCGSGAGHWCASGAAPRIHAEQVLVQRHGHMLTCELCVLHQCLTCLPKATQAHMMVNCEMCRVL